MLLSLTSLHSYVNLHRPRACNEYIAAAAAHRAARRSSGAVAGKGAIYVCAAVGHSYETRRALQVRRP